MAPPRKAPTCHNVADLKDQPRYGNSAGGSVSPSPSRPPSLDDLAIEEDEHDQCGNGDNQDVREQQVVLGRELALEVELGQR